MRMRKKWFAVLIGYCLSNKRAHTQTPIKDCSIFSIPDSNSITRTESIECLPACGLIYRLNASDTINYYILIRSTTTIILIAVPFLLFLPPKQITQMTLI